MSSRCTTTASRFASADVGRPRQRCRGRFLLWVAGGGSWIAFGKGRGRGDSASAGGAAESAIADDLPSYTTCVKTSAVGVIAPILALLVACSSGGDAGPPCTTDEVLAAFGAHGLAYSAVGPERSCWDVTEAGPVRYEGGRSPIVLWVYASEIAADRVWGAEYTGSPRLANGLESHLGCFDAEMWVARKGNVVVALDPGDGGSIATGSIVIEALQSLPGADTTPP